MTVVVTEELMKLYSAANSSELKNLSTIIVEMMVRLTLRSQYDN